MLQYISISSIPDVQYWSIKQYTARFLPGMEDSAAKTSFVLYWQNVVNALVTTQWRNVKICGSIPDCSQSNVNEDETNSIIPREGILVASVGLSKYKVINTNVLCLNLLQYSKNLGSLADVQHSTKPKFGMGNKKSVVLDLLETTQWGKTKFP